MSENSLLFVGESRNLFHESIFMRLLVLFVFGKSFCLYLCDTTYIMHYFCANVNTLVVLSYF